MLNAMNEFIVNNVSNMILIAGEIIPDILLVKFTWTNLFSFDFIFHLFVKDSI